MKQEQILREQIAETGRQLLSRGLVARTWGNVSARTADGRMLITPSGLGYDVTAPADIVPLDPISGAWSGSRKPSSEWGVHAAAYARAPKTDFVIHTHQTYASALGVAGFAALALTEEERARLGGLARADYGLPGTKRLRKNVDAALACGAQVVLMAHHGALILGTGPEDALEKALLLEAVCKRSCKAAEAAERCADAETEAILAALRGEFPLVRAVQTESLVAYSQRCRPLTAQLDDMAQMIGRSLPVAARRVQALRLALQSRPAVLAPGLGALVCGADGDDTDALALLADKAAVTALHAEQCGCRAALSPLDTALMRFVYTKKYAKRKKG